MDEQQVQALVAAAVLAAVHLLGAKMRFLGGAPRSAWLSVFAGISVAYVFVHLLPDLAEGQKTIEEGSLLAYLEDHVYLMALAGLLVFYGVERHSMASRRDRHARAGEDCTGTGAFWLSIASFAVYNAIVGYLLLRGELDELSALALYTAALALHFVVNDFALREHHKDAYERTGRWIISAAVLVGWLLGATTDLSQHAIALVIAFIAGGVILNVLKEELPSERGGRLVPFLAGAVLYAVLLQIG
jgi:hypothetical protein